MYAPSEKERKRHEASRIASAIINEEIDLINGIRKLYSVLCELELEGVIKREGTPAYLGVIAIYSDTDHFPIDNSRKHYAPHYLAQLDKEMDVYIRSYRSHAIELCREIIKLLGK